METINPRIILSYVAVILCLCFASATSRADAFSELAAFSVFDKIDLNQLNATGVKTVRGAPMSTPRFLSAQSCYLVPRLPSREIEVLRQWSPTQHPELNVQIHNDLPSSPGAENFARLRKLPDSGAVRALMSNSQRVATSLQISRGEAQKLTAVAGGGPAAIANFWVELLSSRARAFASAGSSAQPPYDHTGQPIRPSEELGGMLRQQEKIRRQFSGFLDNTGIGRGGGSMHPALYWELLNVEEEGVLSLGAYYTRGGANGTYQAADALYYSSGGFYATLTLYQMWPVNFGGKPSTLVWRGDMVSAASLGSLRGIERLGSESAMIKKSARASIFTAGTPRIARQTAQESSYETNRHPLRCRCFNLRALSAGGFCGGRCLEWHHL